MISIAMATYNGSKYIGQQIESIQKQTIQDFELVICDDCSTDNTCTIIEKYQANDSRIRLYKNDSNLGFKSNFEKVMSLCCGDYIALCDQDDVWYDNHLSALFDALNGGGKKLAVGDMDVVDSDLNKLGYTNFYRESFDRRDATSMELADRIALWSGMFYGMSMMMTREFARQILPIPEECLYHDLYISLVACFLGGISVVDRPLSMYRRHGGNVTSAQSESRQNRFRTFVSHMVRRRTYIKKSRISVLNRIELLADRSSRKLDNHFYELKRIVSLSDSYLYRPFYVFYEFKNFKAIYSLK